MVENDIILCGHGSGSPSTKKMGDFLKKRYSAIAKNGKRKGLVCVKRPVDMTTALRTKFHNEYMTILGRNDYSQTRRSYVYTKYKDGKYYSDCSSSGCATYKRIGLKIDLLNTAGIYYSDKFVDVPIRIKDGQIANPEILKVGDALLFVGEDSSRPRQIGHVEYVYEIKATTTAPAKKAYSGTFPVVPPTLKYGSKGTQVNRLQNFLNWYGGYGLLVDSQFGNATKKAVVDFQKKEKITADGMFGPASLAKAKAVKK